MYPTNLPLKCFPRKSAQPESWRNFSEHVFYEASDSEKHKGRTVVDADVPPRKLCCGPEALSSFSQLIGVLEADGFPGSHLSILKHCPKPKRVTLAKDSPHPMTGQGRATLRGFSRSLWDWLRPLLELHCCSTPPSAQSSCLLLRSLF